MMMPQNYLQAVLIRMFFSVAEKLPMIRQMMEIRGQNVTPIYAAACRDTRKNGHLLPQPRLGDGRLFYELLGIDYTLINFAAGPEKAFLPEEFEA